jgi:hypothetical protein
MVPDWWNIRQPVFGITYRDYHSLFSRYRCCQVIKRRVWKAPFLAMLAAVFIGTLAVQAISMVARLITGVSIPIIDVLNLILLPSLLLNLILAIPVFSIVHDMAGWLFPEELEA